MSYFEQKEWKARLAEFIGRRKLTRVSDGATELYDVTREEGHISQEGDPFSPANMNGLEQRVADGFVKVEKDIETVNSDLDAQKIYSTKETQIGTWIDGRTVYRKCYYIKGDVTVTNTLIDAAFLNSYELINTYGGCYDSVDAAFSPIPTVSYSSAEWNRSVSCNKNIGGLFLGLGSRMTTRTKDVKVIAEYIKPE